MFTIFTGLIYLECWILIITTMQKVLLRLMEMSLGLQDFGKEVVQTFHIQNHKCQPRGGAIQLSDSC